MTDPKSSNSSLDSKPLIDGTSDSCNSKPGDSPVKTPIIDSSKPVNQTIKSARQTLKCNIFGIAGGMASLLYGAYQCGSSGFGATPMMCVGLGIALSVWMMRENYLRDRDIELSIRRAVALDEKGCILARMEDLPSWVYFPETERVEWVNKILRQLWPYVGTYVKEMLKETMEPSIRESLPSYLQSFRFEKIILGDIVSLK